MERELGHGGMASVYLARDLKHNRDVALKVLRPELAAILGPDRFLREIATTAQLTHPGILPLFDSGTDGHRCWYAMPYFSGRTLKDRLSAGGPLPVAEALGVFRDVAGALDHAHRQGILHRDLKPANILLQDGRAVLADFGIALPVGVSAERLTETGFSLGTPEYMSPEQALGARDLDVRSDVYALGCVLYEMLAGEPPFTGTSPQSVLAKRIRDAVPRLPVERRVPPLIESAIARALAREPEDRFQSVAEFAVGLDRPAVAAWSLPWSRWRKPALIAAVLLLALAGVFELRGRRATPVAFDPDLVAVLPARVNAPGQALDYLKEGILDLAAARLTGEGGPRAVDPRATLAALRSAGSDSAGTLARRLGAGKLLDASVVGDARHLTITATLISYPGGARQPPVSVEGQEDSIGPLLDRLMIRVLALNAGERGNPLIRVTSLPAWRAYLRGKAEYRAGRYDAAHAAFEEALGADSSFVLAALADASALVRAAQDPSKRFAEVRRHLDRLGPEDSLYAVRVTGPRYPEATPVREGIAAWETMVAKYPDRADAWFELGDLQLHIGAQVDLDRPLEYAARSLGRALALDSSFALPIDHLLLIAYARGDSAQVRRLTPLYLASDSLGDRAPFYRWRSAVALGDSVATAGERSRFSSLPDPALRMILTMPQTDGIGLGDAQLADSILTSRATTEQDRRRARIGHAVLQLLLGRPTDPPLRLPLLAIDYALFADGDTAYAPAAAREIRAAGTLRGRAPFFPDWLNRWELAWWDLAHGDPATARTVAVELRHHPPPLEDLRDYASDTTLIPLLLEAQVAAVEGKATAFQLADRADSLLATGPSTLLGEEATLVLGRLFTSLGKPDRALRALRRTPVYTLDNQYARATIVLAWARAAVAAGEREEASGAYRLYLAYRSNPGPRLLPQRDSARAELARLVSR